MNHPARWSCLIALVAGLTAAVPARAVLDNSDCFACHGDKDFVRTNAAHQAQSLFVDETAYAASIHAKNRCTSCHVDIQDVPHADKLKPVSCAQCHRIETDIYLKSDHGQAVQHGVTEAAKCQGCHGAPHTLLNSRNPASPVHRQNLPATCSTCHARTADMEKFKLRQRSVTFTYDHSIHGRAHANGIANAAICSDCHGTHNLHRSINPASKLYWQNIPATCGKCHENVNQTYQRSVHGQAVAKGLRDAPVCTDCHGEHTITAVKDESSRVSGIHIPETCGQCHASERIATRYNLKSNVLETYMQSFHGLALQIGGVAVANCASCHGFHDVLPASDPLSSVNQANLPQTCGKCHAGIGTRLAKGDIRIHNPAGAAKGKPWLVNLISRVYILLIIATIGGMATFNFLDYLRKTRQHLAQVRQIKCEVRLTRWLRVQHFFLIATFVLLAYTGFVHKFPDAIFSWPFRALGDDGSMARGMIHRIAGWTFIGLFLVHSISLVFTKRGRDYLRVLWFAWHDIGDGLGTLAFNLGLRKTAPPHRQWNYAEKAEYWALMWGSLVMIVTGLMLLFTETVLRMLPKVWHDVAQVIHYYEAVLATLAIVVWHFYWVIFDPKEYPMNTAWLIGKKAPHDGHAPAAGPKAAEKPDAPR